MNNIILQNVIIKDNIVKYRFDVTDGLKKYFRATEMFIDYGESVENVPESVLSIPFVSTLANFAWIVDATLWVNEIDETYFYSLKQLKVAYQEAHYDYPFRGRFVPSRIICNNLANISEKSLLLFGGGVDCHSTYLRQKQSVREILNINGWLKNVEERNMVDEYDHKMTKDFGSLMNIRANHIRSNFASMINLSNVDKDFYKKIKVGHWYGFLHSMAFIGIAIPLAYLRGYSTIYIASSNTKGQNNVCASDITTDSLHRFCSSGNVVHDGFELNRQDKIRVIVNYKREIGHPYPLHVCSFNDRNCCECEKCFRTVINLIAENEDPREYGFLINGSMTNHWKKVMLEKLGLWGITLEKRVYWPFVKSRMRENYENISDKEFVDWFLNFDFDKAKREGLRRYYRQNFFSILKRKLHIR